MQNPKVSLVKIQMNQRKLFVPKIYTTRLIGCSHRPSLNPTLKSQHPKPLGRLPQLSYSLLKDNALRKKLAEMGIPNGGPRGLLIRRHTEWVNLVNANSDSSRPRARSDLLHDLELWDRSQGRDTISSSGLLTDTNSVMRKDFNSTAWAATHDDEFQKLIGKAREKLAVKDVKALPKELYENPCLCKSQTDSSKNQN